MQLEDSVKTGILFLPPQSFLRKSWQKKYCALYKASNHGIQRLEIFDNEEAYSKLCPSKIIALTDCIKAVPAPQKQQANVFEVRTSTNSFQFSADSFQEMTEWLGVLQMVAFGLRRPPLVLNTDLQTPKEVKNEENMLYSSVDEPEVYSVKAVDTEATVRNSLHGDFKLIVTPVSISLAEEGVNSRSGRILYTWPYRHIRRYGCNKENFSFEAGRKCSSGEGIFTFSTKDSSRIFQSVDAHLTTLKSCQTDEADVPMSPLPSGNSYDSVGGKGFSDVTAASSMSPRLMDGAELSGSWSRFSLGNTTPDSPRKKDTAAGLGRAEVSIPETNQPIPKPPRKSKSKSDVKDNDKKSVSSFARISSIHVGSQPNIYEMPSDFGNYQEVIAEKKAKTPVATPRRGSSYGEMTSSHEPVYAVLEENACDSALTDELKHVLSLHKSNYANLDLDLTETDTSSDHTYFSADSDGYDHLSVLKGRKSRSSSSSDDSGHVYGKLLSSRAPSALDEPQSSNTYGSLLTKKCDISVEQSGAMKHHSYMNVFIPKPMPSDETGTSNNEPIHFLQNDAEYAQVLKKKSG